MSKLKLYMAHCGFYDHGIYESHINIFVVAGDFNDAKLKVKALPEYIDKKMHVDGLLEISAIDGYKLDLIKDDALNGESLVANLR